MLISAGEEVEEVFAEDYDDPDKDLEEEIEPVQVKSVNGVEKEKEEVEEAEDTDIRQVGGKPQDKRVYLKIMFLISQPKNFVTI